MYVCRNRELPLSFCLDQTTVVFQGIPVQICCDKGANGLTCRLLCFPKPQQNSSSKRKASDKHRWNMVEYGVICCKRETAVALMLQNFLCSETLPSTNLDMTVVFLCRCAWATRSCPEGSPGAAQKSSSVELQRNRQETLGNNMQQAFFIVWLVWSFEVFS